MLSLKYKNFIKKTLYEMDGSDAETYIEGNRTVKRTLNKFFDNKENYSFWIIHEDQYNTIFYYIDNQYLNTDTKTLTFNAFKLRVDYSKTSISHENLEPVKIDVSNDKDGNVKNEITRYFGVPGVNYNSALSLVEGILSNVKVDKRYIKNYNQRKFLSYEKEDSEEEKNKNITNKDQYIKDFDEKDVPDVPKKSGESKISNEDIINNMKSETGASFMLDPSHLIGDDGARPLEDVKKVAEENVLKFEKALAKTNTSDTASIAEVAAVIVYKALQTVLTAPCNPMNITKYDINHNKKLEFKKDLPVFNENKNIQEAKSYEYKTDTNGSEILNMVSVNPPEVLTPLAFASMNIPESNWSVDSNGISSKKLVNYLFNRDGNNLRNAKVSYPLKRNQMLYDSIIWVPFGKSYRRINISTKGGKSGHGASASLSGVFQYLLDEQYQTESSDDIKKFGEKICNSSSTTHKAIEANINKFIDTYCSHIKKYNNNFFEKYEKSIINIILFGCTNNFIHAELCKAYYYPEDKESSAEKLLDKHIEETNADSNFSECIMQLLDYQKYDFAQVNCKPYLFGETFSYDYYVQYPAKFSGTVKLEKATATIDKKSYPYVKFHIMGG